MPGNTASVTKARICAASARIITAVARERRVLWGTVAMADNDDRRTPKWLFGKLDKEHHFTVDVTASAENTKCSRHYTEQDSGLEHDWAGEVVWCNPPYSDIEPWAKKAHESSSATVVMLVPANRTEQPWWQKWAEPYRDRGGRLKTVFLEKRVCFDFPDGIKRTSPRFGCVLLVWEKT